MSTELKNITENVMGQIHRGKIKMRPKIYFIIGSILTFIGLVFSIITSIFFTGLLRFSLRTHGPMGQYKLEQMILNFPWWIAIMAVIGLVLGIWLIQQYDFSYKKNPLIIIMGFILAVVFAGWVIDMTGLNDTIFRYGPMKWMMGNYFQVNSTPGNPQGGMMQGSIQYDQ